MGKKYKVYNAITDRPFGIQQKHANALRNVAKVPRNTARGTLTQTNPNLQTGFEDTQQPIPAVGFT